MVSNFQRALSRVLKHEGGYVDHPKDPGGATNKGVTLATFRSYVKPKGTKADLRGHNRGAGRNRLLQALLGRGSWQ